jgi:glucose/arabinose dehydrogenase
VGGEVELIVINISADGMGGTPSGHTTRTLAFDTTGRIYVSVGSAGNVDTDSYRSRIRRCDLSSTLPVDFNVCEVFADGLRKEVGLAFDKHGVLWGVEN